MTEESQADDITPEPNGETAADTSNSFNDAEAKPAAGSSTRIEQAAKSQKTRRRFRWQAGLVIVGLCLLAQLAVAVVFSDGDIRYGNTYRVFVSVYLVTPLSAIALGAWWFFFSGLAWKQRFQGLLGAGIAAGLFMGVYQFDGFGGDMLPRWSPRSFKTREEQLDDFLKSQPTTATPTETTVGEPSQSELGPKNSVNATLDDNAIVVRTGDWPNFRGKDWNSTVTDGPELARDWKQRSPELVWKHPSGVGWSSFSVADGLIFTQEQRGEREAIVCYQLATGDQSWVNEEVTLFTETLGGDGPRSTPTVLNSQVYALGATGILKCLDGRTGSTIWRTNILKDAEATNLQWAMAGSPLIVDGKVIVNPGGLNDSSLAAYDQKTGEPVWSSGTSPASYSTPQMMEVDGIRFITIYDGDGVTGYSIDGQLEWHYAWTNQPKIHVAMPLIQGNRVLVGTAYGIGNSLFEVFKTDNGWDTKSIWEAKSLKPKFNDYVIRNGHVYGLDSGIMVCIDFETGKRKWKRGRYGFGQVICAADLLIVTTEEGEIVLLEATPEAHRELGRIQAVEGKTWSHPALVRDLLLVKSERETACFRLPTQ